MLGLFSSKRSTKFSNHPSKTAKFHPQSIHLFFPQFGNLQLKVVHLRAAHPQIR